MAAQMVLPNFTLETHGDMKSNWDFFLETFESYAALMGYRNEDSKDPIRELAALTYALPKETRLVLKNNIIWNEGENKKNPELTLKKLGLYYSGTKNVIHERVEFNRMYRPESESIRNWETRCRDQGIKCEYCERCTHELIRDRFIVGVNDDPLMSKLVNSAVKKPKIALENIVLEAQQHEATVNRVKTMTMLKTEEHVNFSQKSRRFPAKSLKNSCPWCGDQIHRNGKYDCPAKGKQCFSCGRWDHLGKVCLHPNPNWRTSVNTQSSSYYRHNAKVGKSQVDHVRYTDNASEDVNLAFTNFSIEEIHTAETMSQDDQDDNDHREQL